MKQCNNRSLSSGALAVLYATGVPTFQDIYWIQSELGGRKMLSGSGSSSNIYPKKIGTVSTCNAAKP